MKKVSIILSLLFCISILTILNFESIFASNNNSLYVEDINNNKLSVNNDSLSPKKETSNVLSKEDALSLLKSMNSNLTYIYKGNENNFPILKDKGLYGYVFLPNIDTDLGYFVDKNTSHIYYFHPSGYLELIK